MNVFIVLTIFCKFSLGQDLFPIIRIKDGEVAGKRYETDPPVDPVFKYLGFYGMPYAQPPVGALRFQPPQPVIPWNGVINDMLSGDFCPQYVEGSIIGSEDCLYLDVVTPTIPLDVNVSYPVMVWVHGHESGSGYLFKPDFLVSKDIVLVTVDYRVGLFGFFSTGDSAAYGNNGLKDLVMALQWVKDNIIYFNGDPNRVTVFGESYVHYLQLSPLATGLFHQVIVMNSCALNPRNLQKNMKTYVDKLAGFFNISTASSTDIVAGLQNINSQILTEVEVNVSLLIPTFPTSPHPFAPIIELDHPGAFISRSPGEILASGNYNHVPFMFGYLDRADTIILNNVTLPQLDENPELMVSISLNGPDNYTTVLGIIKDFFFDGAAIIADKVDSVMKVLTNEFFTFGIRKAVEFQRKHDDGFLYRFTYEGENVTEYYHDIWYFSNDTPYYWWVWTIDYRRFNPADLKMVDTFTTILTNFAKYGNPAPVGDPVLGNVTWPKVTSTDVGFLDIGNTLVSGHFPNQTEFDFWQFLFTSYGKPPFDTF